MAKRIVIKVGTSIITDKNGKVDSYKMKLITDQVATLVSSGHEVAIVSSGAIAAGVERLGLDDKPVDIPALQAAASVGQGILFERYSTLFRKDDVITGQILLTQYDTTHRQQYLNAKNALSELLGMRVVPVINENDTTAVDEIRFGDNDTLAALVSVLVEADMMIILSDVDGLYTEDPRSGAPTEFISVVEKVTPKIEGMAKGIGSRFGSGGMLTKINAARIVNSARIAMVITNGNKADSISSAIERKAGTYFMPSLKKTSSKKIWICYGRTPTGTINIDKGAVDAIVNRGTSLLPAGILGVDGPFNIGDTVDVTGPDKVIARGLTNYSSKELSKIKGKRSSEIFGVESGESAEEVIHRDCLVVI